MIVVAMVTPLLFLLIGHVTCDVNNETGACALKCNKTLLFMNFYRLDCTVNATVNGTESQQCTVNLQDLVPQFIPRWQQETVTQVSLHRPEPGWDQEKLRVEFEPSPTLLNNPPTLNTLVLNALSCSWLQLSTLTKHFRVEDSTFPGVSDNQDVYNDLYAIVKPHTQGLKLLLWNPVDDVTILQESRHDVTQAPTSNFRVTTFSDGRNITKALISDFDVTSRPEDRNDITEVPTSHFDVTTLPEDRNDVTEAFISDSDVNASRGEDVTHGFQNARYPQTETDPHKSTGFNQHQLYSTAEEEKGDKKLVPFPGMETVTSLVIQYGIVGENNKGPPPVIITNMFQHNSTIPWLLQNHLWPELSYLELEVSHLNEQHISILNRTAPKLTYVKFYIPFDNMPEVVWTFDWVSLPWRTGFLVVYQPEVLCTESPRLDLSARVSSHKMPPVHFYDAGNRYYICYQFLKLNLHIDLSHNDLDTLGYFQFTFGEDFNIELNLSNNNLAAVDIYSRFHVIKKVLYPKRDCDAIAKVRMLDVSFNQLNDSDSGLIFSDYLLLKHLNNLYMHHNNFPSLPKCLAFEEGKTYTYLIKDLPELRTLDLSHNLLQEPNFDELYYDEYSTIREIYFQDNMIAVVPDFVYQARYLTLANFSGNDITFETMWPDKMETKPYSLGETSIFLESNSISDLDLSFVDPAEIDDLQDVLSKFYIYLDQNVINCSCATHRMYKYLISYSTSERRRDDFKPSILRVSSGEDHHHEIHQGGVEFYEHWWRCTLPSQWEGMALTSVPESTYDYMCVPSLSGCPEECFCFHSWKLGDVVVANCSDGNEHALMELPATLPNGTSHLILSRNRIGSFCRVHYYFSELRVLDLSMNFLQEICPEVFDKLSELQSLDLSNNVIKKLPSEISRIKNLTTLSLKNNRLETLPKSILTMESLEDLDISGNILKCDCHTFWMSGWLIDSVEFVQSPRSILCFSAKGRGKRLIDLHQDDVGCYDVITDVAIGLGVTFGVTIVLAALIYKYKGHIKILLYTRFGFHPWDKCDDNYENMEYDAFVSFCHEDEDWVLNTLMPYLEAPQCGFHLCVHDRDFVPGDPITENITRAIQQSRRTILVLTPEFINSGWCDFEFKAAHCRVLEDRSNYLIVVLLKEIDNKDLDDALQLYMDTNTYVRADDKWFWEKMLYALPKVPIDKLKAQEQEEENPREAQRNPAEEETNQREDVALLIEPQ